MKQQRARLPTTSGPARSRAHLPPRALAPGLPPLPPRTHRAQCGARIGGPPSPADRRHGFGFGPRPRPSAPHPTPPPPPSLSRDMQRPSSARPADDDDRRRGPEGGRAEVRREEVGEGGRQRRAEAPPSRRVLPRGPLHLRRGGGGFLQRRE